MSSHHPSEPSSAASTPRSEHPLPPPPHRWHHPHHHDGGADEEEEEPPGPRVRLMCSFGGRILPRPHDHQLRYVGGETRIVAVPRAASFAALLAKLAKLLPGDATAALQVKYQLPHEDLDALISITSDEDVEIMMEEHERLTALGGGPAARTPRLRLFLFPPGGGAGDFGSLHDGSEDLGSRRERWFLDALGAGAAAALERGRSEVSSVVSEQPDYLFGLDSNSDQAESVHRVPNDRPERVHHVSGFPESPIRRAPDDPPEPPIPDRRPLKTKPADPPTPPPVINAEMPVNEPVQPAAAAVGYPGSRTWQYMTDTVPVYFVPSSVPQHQTGPVPISLHMSYGSQQGNPGPVPMVYQHPVQGFSSNPMGGGPVYVGGLPMAQAGPVGPYGLPLPVPEGYNLPTIVHGPLGGPGVVVSVNPTAGIPSREELPDAVNRGEQSFL